MVYKMTPGEIAIIEKSIEEKNPNIFLNYFLCSEDTGTYWRPVSEKLLEKLFIPEFKSQGLAWKTQYEYLHEQWLAIGRPDYFVEREPYTFRKVDRDTYYASKQLRRYRATKQLGSREPIFHRNHGFLMLPWYLDAHRQEQEIHAIIGGFGSGKTINATAEQLYNAAIYKEYRGFGLAPYSVQSGEIYALARQMIMGTEYQKFLVKMTSRPTPKIVIGHSEIGDNNSFEFYPILQDSDKIRTLTGDAAIVDQSEKLPDIEEVLRDIGTRFRGQIKGRERLGKIAFIANSGDNPSLWDLYDEGKTDPERVFACSPGSQENIYLTIRDMLRYQKVVGNTEDDRRMYIRGGRPLGSGEHFPASSLAACKAEYLDDFMEAGLNAGISGFIKKEAPRVAIHQWEVPYEEGEEYIVIADPGWGDPPARNAAVIMVWKITNFPTVPAHLVAFDWVFGRGSPLPFLSKFTEYVHKYRAIGKCAFDGTGLQSGYERMVSGFSDLAPEPMSMGNNKKFVMLTLAKMMMANGKLAMPSIPHIYSQLSNYVLPEPAGLRQDIVMTILLTAGWLERLYYVQSEQNTRADDPHDRYYRRVEENRYGDIIQDTSVLEGRY